MGFSDPNIVGVPGPDHRGRSLIGESRSGVEGSSYVFSNIFDGFFYSCINSGTVFDRIEPLHHSTTPYLWSMYEVP